MAPARAARVGSMVVPQPMPDDGPTCPFCRGREHLTPPAVVEYHSEYPGRTPHDWLVRVIANRYPAVGELPLEVTTLATSLGASVRSYPSDEHLGGGRFPALGFHEVVIESPDHLVDWNDLPAMNRPLVFRAWRDRLHAWRSQSAIRYATAFKNQGSEAGATLAHVHSQLLAMNWIPPSIQRECHLARQYHQANDSCFWCDTIQLERNRGERIVEDHKDFLVLCPFAGRFPEELWILPTQHASDFGSGDGPTDESLAGIISSSLARLSHLHPHLPFNLILRTAPFDRLHHDHYHWHLEILPRLTRQAGFEWGCGAYINPSVPEQSAQRLRSLS